MTGELGQFYAALSPVIDAEKSRIAAEYLDRGTILSTEMVVFLAHRAIRLDVELLAEAARTEDFIEFADAQFDGDGNA